MRRLGIRIANMALFALCCFLLGDIVNKISARLLLPRSSGVLFSAEVFDIPTRSWDECKPILQRNLFGAQVVSEPIVEVQPEPEEIEKTELPLELLGTIASGSQTRSRAAIWDEVNREYQVLRVGDPLKHHPEVRLDRVERRRVILFNGEQRQELTLEDRERRLDTPAVRKARAREVRARKAEARRAKARERRRRSR